MTGVLKVDNNLCVVCTRGIQRHRGHGVLTPLREQTPTSPNCAREERATTTQRKKSRFKLTSLRIPDHPTSSSPFFQPCHLVALAFVVVVITIPTPILQSQFLPLHIVKELIKRLLDLERLDEIPLAVRWVERDCVCVSGEGGESACWKCKR